MEAFDGFGGLGILYSFRCFLLPTLHSFSDYK